MTKPWLASVSSSLLDTLKIDFLDFRFLHPLCGVSEELSSVTIPLLLLFSDSTCSTMHFCTIAEESFFKTTLDFRFILARYSLSRAVFPRMREFFWFFTGPWRYEFLGCLVLSVHHSKLKKNPETG